MLTAISRYGARVLPDTEQIVARCKARGEFIQGPLIVEFEDAFARRAGSGHAIAASYGRMAFYYIIRALDLPPGSEIILPALTFWVVPDLARVAGLKVVFHGGSGYGTYTGSQDLKPPVVLITEVAQLGDFERTLSWGIGLNPSACYRTVELSNPTRLAIDFQTPPAAG